MRNFYDQLARFISPAIDVSVPPQPLGKRFKLKQGIELPQADKRTYRPRLGWNHQTSHIRITIRIAALAMLHNLIYI
jgi:hypothetical protein